MNQQNYELFKSARKNGNIPAIDALRHLRQLDELTKLAERHNFTWTGKYGQCESATWEQDGFTLKARVVDDIDGWYARGVDVYGRFSDQWDIGAIQHWQGDRRSYKWFIPADTTYRHESYAKACDYGRVWEYVGIEVTASRQGITLSSTTSLGIESDSGEAYFTQVAFDLAMEAMAEAKIKLRQLCTDNCQQNSN